MNHLERLQSLQNNYFFQRHGEAVFNDLRQGRINSNPETGLISNGLVINGVIQARFAARKAVGNGYFEGRPTVIFSSDFKRTRQTALITKDEVGEESTIIFSPKLRERYFGRFEGYSTQNYKTVWENDKKDAQHKSDAVESVEEVMERMTSFVREIEELYTGFNVILVSHGDPLQILETAFCEMDPREHRDIQPMKTGELRRVVFQPRRRNV